MLDEEEFFSPYFRALSRYHAEHPYIVNVHGFGCSHTIPVILDSSPQHKRPV
jgi:hypothetical protein